MERVFLDANVLFSAAYGQKSKLSEFWALKDVNLVISFQAFEEAYRNLKIVRPTQISDLNGLAKGLEIVKDVSPERLLSMFAELPVQDHCIFLAAVEAGSAHFVTGDKNHFGNFYDHYVLGILVCSPSEFLKSRSK